MTKVLKTAVLGLALIIIIFGGKIVDWSKTIGSGVQSEEAAEKTAETHINSETVSGLADDLEDDEYILGAESENSFDGKGLSYDGEVPEDAAALFYLSGTEKAYTVYTEGPISLDPGNEADFTDPNTVLHDDGSGNFVRFLDEDFFYENEYVYVITDEKILEYRIFAAYTAESEDILKERNCYSLSEFYLWLDEIFEMNEIGCVVNASLEEEVMEACRILTIQTDQGDGTDIIVQGTYTGKEER